MSGTSLNLTGYHLTFDDEFNGTSLDTSKWTPQWSTGSEHPSAYKQDQALPSNVTVSGGKLHLTAEKGGTTDGRPYSVGVVQTYNKFDQQYGYIEASIKVPAADGMWPAFWTFPQSGMWTHEVDIMEMFLSDPTTNHMSDHFPSTNGNDQYVTQSYTGPNFSAGFHTFGVMWTPTSLTWYIDGAERFSTTTSVPNESMWLVLNDDTDQSRSWNAVDSSTPFPNTMDVDYVRAYALGAAPTPTPTSDSLTVRVSEDAYKGDAQFTVSVNGQQIGGAMTTSALHATGVSDVFLLNGNWGAGAKVKISFTNDAYGGSASTDRNLYVDSVSYDGNTYAGGPLWSNGSLTVPTGGTPTASPPSDVLTLHLSEDAYKGNADFSLTIDGKQVATQQQVTALHNAGDWKDLTFAGNLGAGSHMVGITFTNDAWGGSASTDRNLYVNGIDVNGVHYGSGAKTLSSTGDVATYNFSTAS